MTALMTAEEVAATLRVLPQQVRRWAISGRLPGVQFGRRWRFRGEVVERVATCGLTAESTTAYNSVSKSHRVGGKALRSWRETPTT